MPKSSFTAVSSTFAARKAAYHFSLDIANKAHERMHALLNTLFYKSVQIKFSSEISTRYFGVNETDNEWLLQLKSFIIRRMQ